MAGFVVIRCLGCKKVTAAIAADCIDEPWGKRIASAVASGCRVTTEARVGPGQWCFNHGKCEQKSGTKETQLMLWQGAV